MSLKKLNAKMKKKVYPRWEAYVAESQRKAAARTARNKAMRRALPARAR